MAYSQTDLNMLAAAGLSPTGGPFDWTSLLPKTTTPTSGTLGGGPPFSTGDPYGKIPDIPQYTTDTSTTTGADLWAQLLKSGGAGVGTNLINSVGAIGSHIGGQVTPTTMADIGSYAAQIGSGAMGMGANAPGANTAALKLLGLTAEGLTKQGLAEQSQLFTSYPYQQGSTTSTTIDWGVLKRMLEASPDPAARAQAEMAAIAAGLNRGGWGGGGGGGIYNPLPSMIASQLSPTMSYQRPYGGAPASPTYQAPGMGTGTAWGEGGAFDAGSTAPIAWEESPANPYWDSYNWDTSYTGEDMGLDEFDFNNYFG